MKNLHTALLVLISSVIVLGCLSFFNATGTISTYHEVDDVDQLLFSANPPVARTGAPGEGNCTACHAGSTQSAVGVVDYTFSEPSNIYYPDSTYSITLSVPSGVKNGFEMTILDGSDNAAGTFTAGTGSSTASSGGRNYIRHSVSTGITSWSFDWTAPDSDLGNLTVYYSFIKANNNGQNSGDEIYLGQESIFVAGDAGFTEHQQLQEAFQVYADANLKLININYQTIQSSRVQLNLIDISGKLIYREDFGQKGPGKYSEKFDYGPIPKTGVYFVSLLINNYAVNQKIFLN